jgi:hypothetical protein
MRAAIGSAVGFGVIQRTNIFHNQRQPILRRICRLIKKIVPAQIGRDHAIRSRKMRDLILPSDPSKGTRNRESHAETAAAALRQR